MVTLKERLEATRGHLHNTGRDMLDEEDEEAPLTVDNIDDFFNLLDDPMIAQPGRREKKAKPKEGMLQKMQIFGNKEEEDEVKPSFNLAKVVDDYMCANPDAKPIILGAQSSSATESEPVNPLLAGLRAASLRKVAKTEVNVQKKGAPASPNSTSSSSLRRPSKTTTKMPPVPPAVQATKSWDKVAQSDNATSDTESIQSGSLLASLQSASLRKVAKSPVNLHAPVSPGDSSTSSSLKTSGSLKEALYKHSLAPKIEPFHMKKADVAVDDDRPKGGNAEMGGDASENDPLDSLLSKALQCVSVDEKEEYVGPKEKGVEPKATTSADTTSDGKEQMSFTKLLEVENELRKREAAIKSDESKAWAEKRVSQMHSSKPAEKKKVEVGQGLNAGRRKWIEGLSSSKKKEPSVSHTRKVGKISDRMKDVDRGLHEKGNASSSSPPSKELAPAQRRKTDEDMAKREDDHNASIESKGEPAPIAPSDQKVLSNAEKAHRSSLVDRVNNVAAQRKALQESLRRQREQNVSELMGKPVPEGIIRIIPAPIAPLPDKKVTQHKADEAPPSPSKICEKATTEEAPPPPSTIDSEKVLTKAEEVPPASSINRVNVAAQRKSWFRRKRGTKASTEPKEKSAPVIPSPDKVVAETKTSAEPKEKSAPVIPSPDKVVAETKVEEAPRSPSVSTVNSERTNENYSDFLAFLQAPEEVPPCPTAAEAPPSASINHNKAVETKVVEEHNLSATETPSKQEPPFKEKSTPITPSVDKGLDRSKTEEVPSSSSVISPPPVSRDKVAAQRKAVQDMLRRKRGPNAPFEFKGGSAPIATSSDKVLAQSKAEDVPTISPSINSVNVAAQRKAVQDRLRRQRESASIESKGRSAPVAPSPDKVLATHKAEEAPPPGESKAEEAPQSPSINYEKAAAQEASSSNSGEKAVAEVQLPAPSIESEEAVAQPKAVGDDSPAPGDPVPVGHPGKATAKKKVVEAMLKGLQSKSVAEEAPSSASVSHDSVAAKRKAIQDMLKGLHGTNASAEPKENSAPVTPSPDNVVETKAEEAAPPSPSVNCAKAALEEVPPSSSINHEKVAADEVPLSSSINREKAAPEEIPPSPAMKSDDAAAQQKADECSSPIASEFKGTSHPGKATDEKKAVEDAPSPDRVLAKHKAEEAPPSGESKAEEAPQFPSINYEKAAAQEASFSNSGEKAVTEVQPPAPSIESEEAVAQPKAFGDGGSPPGDPVPVGHPGKATGKKKAVEEMLKGLQSKNAFFEAKEHKHTVDISHENFGTHNAFQERRKWLQRMEKEAEERAALEKAAPVHSVTKKWHR